jgi:predicted nucleic acid-binding protein
MTSAASGERPCVVDNMVLAMFVDAGQAQLLSDLASAGLNITPTILEPEECPPFSNPPTSEFAKGIYEAQSNRVAGIDDQRIQLRTAFIQSNSWQPVDLLDEELKLAYYLQSRQARDVARARASGFRYKRIHPGEAECAAVAINRGWELWTDDGGIVGLVRALYPDCQVVRTCALLVRAVQRGLIPCADAAHLYNTVFRVQLGLRTSVSLRCDGEQATCR